MSYPSLKALIDRIDANLRAADTARRLPDMRAYAARSIRFESHGLTDAQRIIAVRMRDTAEAEERAAGEVARSRELRRLAVELDQLRAELPALAAAARFDLLDTVRDMRLAR